MVQTRKARTSNPDLLGTDAERACAMQLLRTYKYERRQHHGRQIRVTTPDFSTSKFSDAAEVSSGASKSATMWLGLARKVMSRRVPPEKYIRVLFSVRPRNLRAWHINEMGTAEAFASYERQVKRNEAEIDCDFRREKQILKTESDLVSGVTMGEAWARVLGDVDAPLTPLFRYCMSLIAVKSISMTRGTRRVLRLIAQDFKYGAALQYVEDEELYDVVWGNQVIPTKFKKTAAVVYEMQFKESS